MNDWRAFFDLLASLGIASDTVEHEEVHTAQGLADRDVSRWEFPVKNIVVEDKAKQLYLVTMHLLTPPLDLKALAKQLGANGRFSFASPETMGAALKVRPGSVTPFALVNDTERRVLPIFDDRMRVARTVSAHPLVNTMTTTIAMDGLMRLLRVNGHEPRWCELPLKAPPEES